MNTVRFLLLGSSLGLLLCGSTVAATLTGRVRDANTNSYLLGTTVALPALGRDTATNSEGEYLIANLPAGTYTVVASFMGYSDGKQTVVVPDTGEARADFALGAEIVQMGQFVVEGTREGQARALQQKRTADNIIDVVSADSAGQLPDGNAAEAVRRLPGVYAEIDQNEGRYIVVRGLDAALNNTMIDGMSFGSTESGTRGAAMDSVPADLISRIEVVKAVTPNMDHSAIGASVNIVTPSAFDRKERFVFGKLAGVYFAGPGNEIPYNGSATFGTVFGDGKWGVVVGGSYSYRRYISNRCSGGNPWSPAVAGSDVYFPVNETLFYYEVQRWRQGLKGALEFRPNSDHRFALRIGDNRFKDIEGREQNNFNFFRAAPTSFTPTSATFASGQSTVEYRYYRQKHNITTYAFEGKHTFDQGRMNLDYTFSIGDANKQTPDRQDWEFRSGTNITSTIDTSSRYYVVKPDSRFFDGATFPFRRVRFRQDDEGEDNYAAKVDLKRIVRLGQYSAYWQVGGKIFSRDKGWNRTNADYNAGTGANLLNLGQYNISSPGRSLIDGRYQMSPQINLPAIQAFFAANPRFFVLNANGTLTDSAVDDFKIEEKISAAYAMGRLQLGGLSLLAGARMERSSCDVTQTELPTVGSTLLAPRLNQFTKRYTNLMPGLHLRYTLAKNWQLRASFTNTIARPNYPHMAGSSTFTYTEVTNGSGTYIGSISSGNPTLKPYEATNLDVTSEYYFRNSGIFSVSGFSKQIDNPIFTKAYTVRNTNYNGLQFELLSFSRPENAEGGKIKGVEFNYQQQLTMLPSPFNGLGFSVNYTLTDSEQKVFTRPNETLPFNKQADQIYNVALSYEKYRVRARIAYTHTGAFLKAISSSRNGDQYQAERNIIDAKISYRLSKRFTLFADVINLGEEPLDEYAGYPHRTQATEHYWLTANFGIDFKL